MIVRPKPTLVDILTTLRGSVIPTIAPKVLAITVISAGVVSLAKDHPALFTRLSATPFTLMGIALSIFLSFRNNACYERWWEARKQWGLLIIECRSLAREVHALLPGEANTELRQRLLRQACGFANALAARLRSENEAEAAARWSPSPERLATRRNVPDALLADMGVELAASIKAGRLSDIQYSVVEARLNALSAVQAACERILYTPLPFAYTLLLHRTAYLFCILLPFGLAASLGWATLIAVTVVAYTFFGLDALGDELEEPFGLAQNDLPLNALVRVIERDLLESLGERDLPPPLQPVDFVLR